MAYTIQIPEFRNLSISQNSSPAILNSNSNNKKKKSNPLDITSNTDPTLLLSDYSNISNVKLREMLLTAIPEIDINTNVFMNFLDNEEMFIFIRQLIQLINKLNYYKLQYEQWSYYYNLGTKEKIWTGRGSKKIANINSMCNRYGRSKVLIQQHHQKYKQQFDQMQKELNEYLKWPTPISVNLAKMTNHTSI